MSQPYKMKILHYPQEQKYCHMLQAFHIQSDAQKRLFPVNIRYRHFYFISP